MARLTQDRPGAGLPLWSDYSGSSGGTAILHRRCSSALGPAGRLRLGHAAAVHLLGDRVGRAGAGPRLRHARRRPSCCRPRSASTPTPSCSSSPRCSGPSAEALGTDPRPGRSSTCSVTASPNSHVLHVTVSGRLPARGGHCRRRRGGGVRRRAPRRARRARGRPAPPAAALRHRTGGAAGPGADAAGSSSPRSDELFAELLELRAGLEELEEAREPARARWSSPPDRPASADYANAEVPMTSGAMLGLLAGCAPGAARDRDASPTA